MSGSTQGEWTRGPDGGMARNVDLLAYHDLGAGNAGYQMAMQEVDGRFYLYCAHWAKQGISCFEVTDPTSPRFVRYVPEPSGRAGVSSVKLQVADGIGILNMQTRKFDMFFGPQPEGTEYDEGVVVWDFSDPEAPLPVGRWSSGSPFGTHRNYYDGGRYVHLTSGAPGHRGFIYRILDIADVSNPVVVGEWAHPEQWTLEDPASPHVELHMPYVDGDRAYLAYWGVGMVVLDISDVTQPRHVATLRTHPPMGGGSGGASVHTIVPFPDRDIAVVSTEGERPFVLDPNGTEGIPGIRGKQHPMNIVGIASLADPSNPVLVSVCPKPTPPPGSAWGQDYSTLDGTRYPFGNHNVHQPQHQGVLDQRSDRIYCSYFQAGLRVFDISDAYAPVEIAAYCPPDPTEWSWQRNGGFPGPLTACAEDIIVDRRGVVYMTSSQAGIHILRVRD